MKIEKIYLARGKYVKVLYFRKIYDTILHMAKEENIHAGHRERMLGKVLKNVDVLSEHELLEVLLYPLMPRKDTNPLAHKIIRMFGSVESALKAPAKELMLVDGVGKQIATHLSAMGKVFSQIAKTSTVEEPNSWLSFYNTKKWLQEYFKDATEEKFLFVLLDAKHRKIVQLPFENEDKYSVVAEIPEIAKAIALHKPKSAIVAHNHPSGNVAPSEVDDFTTMKINLLCEMHGVRLVDHVIVGKDDAFSYHVSGRLEHVRSIADVNSLLENIAENKK